MGKILEIEETLILIFKHALYFNHITSFFRIFQITLKIQCIKVTTKDIWLSLFKYKKFIIDSGDDKAYPIKL